MSTQLITTAILTPVTITKAPPANDPAFEGWYIDASQTTERIGCASGQTFKYSSQYAWCCGASDCAYYFATRCSGNYVVGTTSGDCGTTASCLTMSIFDQQPLNGALVHSNIICGINWSAFSLYRTILTTTTSTSLSVITSIIPAAVTSALPVSTTPVTVQVTVTPTPSPTPTPTPSQSSSSSFSSSIQASSQSNTASSSIGSSTPGAATNVSGGVSVASNGAANSSNTATAVPVTSNSSQAWIAGAVIGPIIGIALIAGLLFFFLRRRKRNAARDSYAVPPAYAPVNGGHKEAYAPMNGGYSERYGKVAAAGSAYEMGNGNQAYEMAHKEMPSEAPTNAAPAQQRYEMYVDHPSTGPYEMSESEAPRANFSR